MDSLSRSDEVCPIGKKMTGTCLGLLPWLARAIWRMAEQAVCSLECRVRAHMLASWTNERRVLGHVISIDQ